MPYIVIEGGEATGKGTLVKMLKESFPDAVFVAEPGTTDVAKEIRKEIKKRTKKFIKKIRKFKERSVYSKEYTKTKAKGTKTSSKNKQYSN